MKDLVRKIMSNRFGLIALLVTILVVISLLTRLVLTIRSAGEIDFSLGNMFIVFFVGLFYDLVNASYYIIPLLLYVWLVPTRVFNWKGHVYVLYFIFFFFNFLLLFNAVAEWFFWDEFSVRFNFIAVDYLVYTTEVIGNVRESYPVEWIIAVLLVLDGALVYMMAPWIRMTLKNPIRFGRRSLYVMELACLPVLFFFTVSFKGHQLSANQYVNELAGNGLYELFAAYRNNELDYTRFYKTIDNQEAFAILRDSLKTPEVTAISPDPLSIERTITNPGEEQKLNVVMISVESLSADFLGLFGNDKNITPFMDSLADVSLTFTNFYATGTRTVRGLEALSLCVPPTPGQSIVRRPNNEDLFTLGKVFESKGYESKYIYGGYGYFDNMNNYFSKNNYAVKDRMELEDSEIHYENIWGVADEDLFVLAMREIEKTLAEQKLVFAHVMTTSNHRPFTYPEGRIDIPSHSGRDGAVKYTDYAIGQFLRAASKKPWFDQTIFIVVADHCASSAGKTELPIDKYHIPLFIYSPAHIAPAKVDRLMSQIDLGPTLLGLLNFSYESKFYGYDLFKLEPGRERAFISTYQDLGFIKNDRLIILSPQQKTASFSILSRDGTVAPAPVDPRSLSEAIAWYQTASYSFEHGLMK